MTFLDSALRAPQGFWIPLALGVLGVVLCAVSRYRLRQTTLTAPAVWGILSIAMLAWSCAYAARLPHEGSPIELREALSTWNYLRYAAAALIIAPTLAQLGAKTPQNAAWQFIVLTLVVVLLLPVLQGWAYGDAQPHVHGLFRWLLLIHVFLGVGNYLFTRFAPAVIVFGAGELAIIAEYLPIGDQPTSQLREFVGLLLVVAGLAVAVVLSYRRRDLAPGIARLWVDFRDAFGTVWTLRIAERLNESARVHRWPVAFSWAGIAPSGATSPAADLANLDPALRHRIERELRSYLRRFVSHDWIAARLPHDSPAEISTSSHSEPSR